MATTARDILVDAVESKTLQPGLVQLVQELPRPISPWSTNSTVASYAGLIDQAQAALILWEEAPSEGKEDCKQAALHALGSLTEWLDSMTYAMRDFLSEIDAPAAMTAVGAGIETTDTSVATVDRDKAIDKLRDGVDNGRMPPRLRTLLEETLDAEAFQTAADEILAGADAIRDQITNLEDQVSELEGEADDIEQAARAVEDIGEAVVAALDAVSYLDEAEGRDEKEEAREGVLEALAGIVEAYDEAEGTG